MNIRYQDMNTAIRPKSAERIRPKWWNSMLCHILASSTEQWLDSCYTKFVSRNLTLLILQSGVTLIPHHLGLDILLYLAQAPDSLYLSSPLNALFSGCPMRDNRVSFVKVGLERAALDSAEGVESKSAPQAGDDQDGDKCRDARIRGLKYSWNTVLAKGFSTVVSAWITVNDAGQALRAQSLGYGQVPSTGWSLCIKQQFRSGCALFV